MTRPTLTRIWGAPAVDNGCALMSPGGLITQELAQLPIMTNSCCKRKNAINKRVRKTLIKLYVKGVEGHSFSLIFHFELYHIKIKSLFSFSR